jgi:kynureninase
MSALLEWISQRGVREVAVWRARRGYLYVRTDLLSRLRPAATGWMAHRHPFEFEPGPIDYAADAFRFLNGTPNVPALYSARSGYEIVNQISVESIRAKSIRQTRRLIELADEAGIPVRSCRDARTRGGVVVIDGPKGEEVAREIQSIIGPQK